MAANISSRNIKVFPSAKRGANATYAEARLSTEASLINIINQLVDVDSFVITDTYEGNKSLEFNIHGYYFKILSPQLNLIPLVPDAQDIFASITLIPVGGLMELNGVDDDDSQNSLYRGLGIGASAQDAQQIPPVDIYQIFTMHLLTKSGNNWIIPEESKLKFNKSLGTIIVDGGEI